MLVGIFQLCFLCLISPLRGDETSTKIALNSLISGEVLERSWNYYAVKVDQNDVDLTVVVKAIAGDPDLYVSYGSLPTPQNYDSFSREYGNAIVDIHDAKQEQEYYIGIYSFGNATYQLRAFVTKETEELLDEANMCVLSEGLGDERQLFKNDMHYCYFDVTPESRVKKVQIFLNASFGDPDIYFQVDSPPTTSNFTMVSAYSGAEGFIVDNKCSDLKEELLTLKGELGDGSVEVASSITTAEAEADVGSMDLLREGRYYIGVHSFSTSVYALTAEFTCDEDEMSTPTPDSPIGGNLSEASHTSHMSVLWGGVLVLCTWIFNSP